MINANIVLVCGGRGDNITGVALSSCELYDVASGLFTATGTFILFICWVFVVSSVSVQAA
jgi:hypothetical protein